MEIAHEKNMERTPSMQDARAYFRSLEKASEGNTSEGNAVRSPSSKHLAGANGTTGHSPSSEHVAGTNGTNDLDSSRKSFEA